MLLGCSSLINTKINNKWDINMITIWNNRIIKIISINQKKRHRSKLLKVLIYYNFIKGLIEEKKTLVNQ